MTMITSEGALTTTGYAAIQAAAAAVEAANRHPGGRLAGWHRQIARSQYTINPAKPQPDDLDAERGVLFRAAASAVSAAIAGGAISLHDASVRGWL